MSVPRSRALALFLATLLVAQAALLIGRLKDSEAAQGSGQTGQVLLAGDTVLTLRGVSLDGRPRSVVMNRRDGKWTVVLAYHSKCAHCATVAPEWSTWLKSLPESAVALAVSREPPDSAAAYAKEHGWEVPLLPVPGAELPNVERYLVSRTPWVFVFDSEGVFVGQAHGAELNTLVAQLVPR